MTIREPFNAISHAVGVVLSAIGAGYLLATRGMEPVAAVAFSIYALVNVLLFGASAGYHWATKAVGGLQKFDHASIYLMIAGTYTPVALLAMEGPTQWAILAIEWVLAAIGVIATFTMQKPPTWLRLTLYLVMGWIALPVLGQLSATITPTGVAWLLAGGLVYTVGTVVYATKKPNLWPGKFGSHELWHCFVMGGAACHFAMMSYLPK